MIRDMAAIAAGVLLGALLSAVALAGVVWLVLDPIRDATISWGWGCP